MKPSELQISDIMKSYQNINYEGFQFKTTDTYAQRCDKRQKLSKAEDEVYRAREMLTHPTNVKYFSGKQINSYRLKHVAECKFGNYQGYVSEGALICAAIIEGYNITQYNPTCITVDVLFPGKKHRRSRFSGNWNSGWMQLPNRMGSYKLQNH